jgi:hypothetical protein
MINLNENLQIRIKNETHSESHAYEKLIYRKQKTSMEYMKTWHHQALVLKVMEIIIRH